MKMRLEHIFDYISEKDIIEFRMNKPHEVIIDKRGVGLVQEVNENLTTKYIWSISKLFANRYNIDFSEAKPQISCVMPYFNHRYEAAFGASAQNGISLAVRCKHKFIPEWDMLVPDVRVQEFLKSRMLFDDNIIISGSTNTGKTTLLNKLISVLPEHKRVIAVEDTPEVDITKFWNGKSLLASRSENSGQEGLMTWEAITNHLNRITPDNIIFGEISTTNTFPALNALNTGNKGFMCTIHAESPEQAIFYKFAMNLEWGGRKIENIGKYLSDLIDLVIQIKRNDKGVRQITDLYLPKTQTYLYKNGVFNESAIAA